MSSQAKRGAEDDGGAGRAKAAAVAESSDSDDMVGPMPVADDAQAKKKKRVLAHEKLFLENLPSAEQYECSFMHRDTVTHVVVAKTDFIITASADGHIKFWKKNETGVEFVKHFKSHLGSIEDLAVSFDGLNLASTSNDQSLKIYDIINFDMINMMRLDYQPSVCEWIYAQNAPVALIACGEQSSGKIRIYNSREDAKPLRVLEIHSHPLMCMQYHLTAECLVSCDESGLIEYFSTRPGDDFAFPTNVAFKYKSDTDLYDLCKVKATPHQLRFSPDGKYFVLTASDRKIRVFEYDTGKLYRVYEESIAVFTQQQQDKALMGSMEFGRRIAAEKDLIKSPFIRHETAVFDESSNFILYPTLIGIKVVNIKTNRCVRIIGKGENTRFISICLYQGDPNERKALQSLLTATDNPNLAQSAHDPTLFAIAPKKNRFFIFTQREPEETGGEVGRDKFNEKPTKEEQMIAAAGTEKKLAESAIIHTVLGDIHLKLFPAECPKTVENFIGHSQAGYYNGCIFHRVIKGFMIQTGDPDGDGCGGTSIWDKNFEDEFHPSLKHDRPYTLSMANSGPNTNGSQFFITVVPTPWLDNKHTVFGRVSKGMEVCMEIANARTNPKTEKPYEDIKIVSITVK
eukprot:m.106158 g.106158  ORF g.106158 m.106158 type:complete len:628 (+) comp15809_c0_seq2:41-1924(+)